MVACKWSVVVTRVLLCCQWVVHESSVVVSDCEWLLNGHWMVSEGSVPGWWVVSADEWLVGEWSVNGQ